MEPAALRAALIRIADEKSKVFPTLLKTLVDLLKRKYPPHILSVLAGYGLITGVSDEGTTGKTLISNISRRI
jgi:hypothetical protein